jgi:aminoglycoside phosphotransferase (APT) family kinase protein
VLLPLPTPVPIALDSDGAWFGTPALVMSALPGRVIQQPEKADLWLAALARGLAAIHYADLPATLPEEFRQPHLWTFWEPWYLPADRRTAAILRAVDELRSVAERQSAVLCHCDYHPGNVLFEGDRVSGIVDWGAARFAPPESDVADCRAHLAVTVGEDFPDRFAYAYAENAGADLSQLSLWDVLAGARALQWGPHMVEAFTDVGLTITTAQIRSRARRFVDGALRAADY